MIVNFCCKIAEDIFHHENSRYARKLPAQLHTKAARLLDQLNATARVEELKIPPANKLKKLGGDLKGFWRIKIDKQWAIIFKWIDGQVFDVQIIDYH